MREERFTFVCNEHERRLITEIASRLKRTQSDAIRLLVRIAAEELSIDVSQGKRWKNSYIL